MINLLKKNNTPPKKEKSKNTKKNRLQITFIIILILILTEIMSSIQPYEFPIIFRDTTCDDNIKNTGVPFERTISNNTIWVIDARKLDKDEQFSAVSLQGIINRNRSSIYIIYSENDVEWLNYLKNITTQTIKNCTLQDAISMFSQQLSGVVIFDNREMSKNLATIYSGLYAGIMVKTGKDTYGLKIIKDATVVNEKTYTDLYTKFAPLCNKEIIANLAPHNIKSRDYIIQHKMLCINLKPGPISWPGENSQFIDIISEYTRGNSGTNRWVFGWFETPMFSEEDYILQVLSHYGVIFLPCSNVPNLSLLQAINATIEIEKHTIEESKPEKKVYITFGFADGDSLDVMYKSMNSYWKEPLRDEIPIAWTVNPAIFDIAPIIMQYYLDTASLRDSFIAAGSGLGIIFPDFYNPDLLQEYIRISSSYDLDYVWLLNSYTPYETRYSNQIVEMYAEQYDGMVLDYGSWPIKSPFWRQYNKPFVRSLHYLGDVGDMKAKLLEITMLNDQPLFLYITLYPWSKDKITNIIDIIDSVCNDYELVDLDQFFYLINTTGNDYQYFEDTRRSIASTRQLDDMLAGTLSDEGWIMVFTMLTLSIWFFIPRIFNFGRIKRDRKNRMLFLMYCGTANVLYLTTVFWVLFQNYWQWSAMGIVPLLAIAYPFIRRKKHDHKKEKYVFPVLLLSISALLSIQFPAGILFSALGYFLIVKSYPNETVITMPFSISIAIILSFFIWTIWALLPVLLVFVLIAYRLKNLDKVERIYDENKNDGGIHRNLEINKKTPSGKLR